MKLTSYIRAQKPMKSLFYLFAVVIICISCSKEKDPIVKEEELPANIKKERDCLCTQASESLTFIKHMESNTLEEHIKECGSLNNTVYTCKIIEVTDDVKERTCVCRSEESGDIVSTVLLPADSYSNQQSKCESGSNDDIYCEIED